MRSGFGLASRRVASRRVAAPRNPFIDVLRRVVPWREALWFTSARDTVIVVSGIPPMAPTMTGLVPVAWSYSVAVVMSCGSLCSLCLACARVLVPGNVSMQVTCARYAGWVF